MHLNPSRTRLVFSLALIFLVAVVSSPQAQTSVRFQDKTSLTGLALPGGPNTASGTEVNGDAAVDLQVNFTGIYNAVFWESDSPVLGVPRWDDKTQGYYGSAIPAPGTRAPVTLDFDNDGHVDLLATGEQYLKLFRGTGSSFNDVTSSSGMDNNPSPLHATAADFDGDGWTDILVYNNGGNVSFWQNQGNDSAGVHQGFALEETLYVTPGVPFPGVMTTIDIDADGDLDVFVGDSSGGSGGGGSSGHLLVINQSPSTPRMAEGTIPSTLNSYRRMESVAVADILSSASGPPLPELVFSGKSYAFLFENVSGTLTEHSSAGGSTEGNVRVLDVDLDGALDILHYAGTGGSTVLRHQTSPGTFTNIATTVGISTANVMTGITADFDADGDVDIFQGDPAASPVHYLESWDTTVCPTPPCSPGADDPAADWIRVTPRGHPVGQYKTSKLTATDLIGTRLRLTGGPAVWIQGESGSSSGVGMPLSFGYGGGQSLEVRWPNGHTTTHAVSANTDYTLLDQSVPYVKQPTVDVQTVYGIGTVSLDISWKTVGPATTDRVVITHVAGSGGCYDFEQTLQQSAAQTQTQTGFNEYTHQITWDDRDCHPNCVFDVRVYSDNPVASSWSLKERIKITSCIGGF